MLQDSTQLQPDSTQAECSLSKGFSRSTSKRSFARVKKVKKQKYMSIESNGRVQARVGVLHDSAAWKTDHHRIPQHSWQVPQQGNRAPPASCCPLPPKYTRCPGHQEPGQTDGRRSQLDHLAQSTRNTSVTRLGLVLLSTCLVELHKQSCRVCVRANDITAGLLSTPFYSLDFYQKLLQVNCRVV